MKIAIAYIPVVHRGHYVFCQNTKPDILYILGKSFLGEYAILERDIRALEPEIIASIARALDLAPKVSVFEKKNLSEIRPTDTVVLADDDVMHTFATEYLSSIRVSYERVFLRWDKMAAITSQPLSSEIIISKSEIDWKYIKIARQNAKKSYDWWRQIGALIVKEGRVLVEGFNRHYPSENAPYIHGDPRANFNAGEQPGIYTSLHAEAELIAHAAEEGTSLRDTLLYSTTFPCPNCALMIIRAGIRAVYFSVGYSNIYAEENL